MAKKMARTHVIKSVGLMTVIVICLLWAGCVADSSFTSSSVISTYPTATYIGSTIKIGLTQFATHPAADAGRRGFIEALKDAGYEEGKNVYYDYQNPEGDNARGSAIAQKFVDDKVDLIFSFGTGVSQAAVKAARGMDIPVVFCSVTDPIGAGLVSDFQHTDQNVTGTTDLIDSSRSLDMILEIVPDLENLGTLYNPNEQNSVTLTVNMRSAAMAAGIGFKERKVASGVEVWSATQSLVKEVDAIWVGTDNTVISSLGALLRVAHENLIPFFPSDDASVKAGGIACLGFDDYKIGYQTGQMAVRILQGTAASRIPVESSRYINYSVNLKAAQAYAVSIPPDILEQAINQY